MALASSLGLPSAFARPPQVEDPTLQKVLDALSPDLTNEAVSVTVVRTAYAPQPLGGEQGDAEPAVTRTTVSEILAGSSYVKESLADACEAGGGVKQFAHHFADDGRRVCDYDSRNRRGAVRRSPKADTNYAGLVTGPYAAANRSRFVSRGMPVFVSRLARATVTSEQQHVHSGNTVLEIEGEYANNSPEARFKMVVDPNRNFAIVQLTEFDSKDRILAEMSAVGFRRVTGSRSALFLPTEVTVRRYRRDDHEGNSVQTHTMALLEARVAPAQQADFVLAFPDNAKRIHDATVDSSFAAVEAMVADVAALDDLPSARPTKADKRTLSDKKGKSIVERARQQHAAQTGREMALPQSNTPAWPIIGAAAALLLSLAGVALLRRRRAHANAQADERGPSSQRR